MQAVRTVARKAGLLATLPIARHQPLLSLRSRFFNLQNLQIDLRLCNCQIPQFGIFGRVVVSHRALSSTLWFVATLMPRLVGCLYCIFVAAVSLAPRLRDGAIHPNLKRAAERGLGDLAVPFRGAHRCPV